jgi:hypothetical protein
MSQMWFYSRDETRTKSGPVSSAEIRALAKSGELQPTDKVWRKGMAQWVLASKIKGLFPSPSADWWRESVSGEATSEIKELFQSPSCETITRKQPPPLPVSAAPATVPTTPAKPVAVDLNSVSAPATNSKFDWRSVLSAITASMRAISYSGASPPVAGRRNWRTLGISPCSALVSISPCRTRTGF